MCQRHNNISADHQTQQRAVLDWHTSNRGMRPSAERLTVGRGCRWMSVWLSWMMQAANTGLRTTHHNTAAPTAEIPTTTDRREEVSVDESVARVAAHRVAHLIHHSDLHSAVRRAHRE